MTAVLIPQEIGGLEQESVALCHQITTLDRAKLTKKIGELSDEWMKRIEDGLKATTDLS